MKRILTSVDFSPHAQQVLTTATELAKVCRAEMWVLHVAAPDPDFVGMEVGPQYVRDARAEVLQAERTSLREMADTLEAQGIKAHPRLVAGETIETILAEADQHYCDLIVLGAHQGGPVRRFVLGSTSEGVLRKAHRPILVVPCPVSE